MKQEDIQSVLIAAIETADELLTFLWNNAEEEGSNDHNIEINVSESHMHSFIALMNEAKDKIREARLIIQGQEVHNERRTKTGYDPRH